MMDLSRILHIKNADEYVERLKFKTDVVRVLKDMVSFCNEAADELDFRPDTEENDEVRELLVWFGDWNPYEFDPKKIRFENPRDCFIKALDLD